MKKKKEKWDLPTVSYTDIGLLLTRSGAGQARAVDDIESRIKFDWTPSPQDGRLRCVGHVLTRICIRPYFSSSSKAVGFQNSLPHQLTGVPSLYSSQRSVNRYSDVILFFAKYSSVKFM
jgi:hypothetical protein